MRSGGFLVVVLVAASALAQGVSLTVPASTPAGGPFEVAWSGGAESSDRIEIVGADGRSLSPRAYGYANRNRRLALVAPARPGTYTIVYQQGSEVLASVALEVTPVTATLDGPGQVAMGQSFEVSWTGPAYRQDSVGLYDAAGRRVTNAYDYVANTKGGPVGLQAPAEPGEYEVRYVMGEEILASYPVTVGGAEATLTAAAKGQAGSDLDVGWSGPDNKGDTIAIVPRGADGRSPGASYVYTEQSVGKLVTLVLPEELGAYDVVYLTADAVIGRSPVDVVAVTASVTAPAEVVGTLAFEASWKGPGNRQDRVVVADPATGEETRAYAYIDPLEAVVTIIAPEAAGQYELRYVTGAGKVLARRPITVTPPPENPGWLRVTRDLGRGLGEGSAVEVILDASGSMLLRQGQRRRIEIAKETLTGLVTETIPAGTGFAMRVFGHQEAGSCRTDLELPLGRLDPAAVSSRIAGIHAMNRAKTPIGASLAKVAEDLAAVTGERIVILVTDGEETCDGDPALAIKSLRARGWDLRVNIVGYAIDDEDLKRTFESWAALGGGEYLDAGDAEQLAAAVTRAVATRFDVLDGEGSVIAQGVANDAAIELPAAEYTVRYALGGESRKESVRVVSEETVELALQ